jgi:hypothetical protein
MDVYTSNLATPGHPQFTLSATPSTSPFKDPLRRSPAKPIRANKTVPDLEEYWRLLSNESVTTAEKDLASRVVEASEKLRSWCLEIEQWGWSGSFDSSWTGPRSLQDVPTASHDVTQYCASLPQEQVETFENRLDAIDEELEILEVDELKERVLGIHLGRSRPSSSYSTQSMTTLLLMDDFQLFVTEAMMQTLPYHSKLKQYMRAWSTRLAVFGKVPRFLETMSAFTVQMNQAYPPLQDPLSSKVPLNHLHQLQERLETKRHTLSDQIGTGGRLLDGMLDILEGSEDTLPEQWIDRFEKDEKEYSDWSVLADRQLFKIRMLAESVDLEDTTMVVPPLQPLNSEAPGSSSHVQEAVASTGSEETTEPSEGRSKEEQHDDEDRNITPDAVETRLSDPETTTIHHTASTASTPFPPFAPFVGPPITIESVNASAPSDIAAPPDSPHPTTMSPRDSTSTIASQLPPESCSQDSSGPSSPSDEIKRPISWDTQASSPQSHINAATSEIATKTENSRPSTPTTNTPSKRRDSISSIASSVASDRSESKHAADDSPSMRASTRNRSNAPRPPLNFAMTKRRKEYAPFNDKSRTFSAPFSDMENLSTDFSPPSSPTKSVNTPRPSAVPLDEQISNILDSIPTAIRLKRGPSANAAEIKPWHNRQPRFRAVTPSSQALPALTLTPAEDITTRKSGSHDPEIKLYHLSEQGKDKPIKLFVRRVGENGERVMVRVGGGWADLGEYLRGYAEHHGRRTASDGRVEVMGLSNDGSGSPILSPTSPRTSRVPSIGSSALAGTTFSSDLSDARSPTPSLSINNTPQATDDNCTPLSSSAQPGTGSRRGSPAPWDLNDVSLAGPAHRGIKKGEMSEEKKQWVDDIVEQAKASVPNVKIGLGDLGKKGATRRVFLKGGKPQVE